MACFWAIAMSVDASAAVWRLNINPGQKLVMLALADYADAENKCWPSVEHLQQRTSMGRSTIMTHLAACKKRGLLAITKQRWPNGTQRSSLYVLNLPGPESGHTGSRIGTQQGPESGPSDPSCLDPSVRSEDRSCTKVSENPVPYQAIVAEWNAVAAACGLPSVKELTDKRKAALKARWTHHPWRDGYRQALEKIPDSPFLRGENGRGWRADFDFFVRTDSVTKILEGKYESSARATGSKKSFAASKPM